MLGRHITAIKVKPYLNIDASVPHGTWHGRVYRPGNFLSKTVQIIPHFTYVIQDWVKHVSLP
ncbi:hypothetical protein PCANC_04176 [Puccinia coronata f. sp. avenae]|uniref:Uncharacterized protein n=1 Tax=Puccinia coronata f. sp. avenae TaxID=200324 RepID=A0A2N5W7H2_9BASI|nr:hypothetical protein PCANC_04176 [Puccinia coronata f. sp. avenae]